MKDMIHRNANYHHEKFFSGVVIGDHRNQGKRLSNWEKDT